MAGLNQARNQSVSLAGVIDAKRNDEEGRSVEPHELVPCVLLAGSFRTLSNLYHRLTTNHSLSLFCTASELLVITKHNVIHL